MPRKFAKERKLQWLLCSQFSTPEEILNAFMDYMKSTKEFYNRRYNRGEILKEVYEKTIKSLVDLEIQIKELVNQVLRPKKLFTENAQYKVVLIHSVEVATRNEKEYEKEISNYKKMIEEIYHQIDDIDFSVINNESNKICYSTLEEAICCSKERIQEIDDDGKPIYKGGLSTYNEHNYYEQKCETGGNGPIPHPYEQKYDAAKN
ncbi:6693_t:CDS:2 [Gigaspora margarita]|uniref:6693_t:CDS:1 n=1 Tax=Gigaspora margarita TaxID=4874 RepID=A0ABM8VX49_GIGMA|nr:6693_t:CDS:2 [Gigaspora margarita]